MEDRALMQVEQEEKLLSSMTAPDVLRHMAIMIRLQGEKLDRLEREMARMVRLKPVEVAEINEMIRYRVARMIEEYRLDEGFTKNVNMKIRRDIKVRFGGLVKELSQMDYEEVKDFIRYWEDTKFLRELHTRGA